jgi:adenosylmethionine---8-amino-7-oxononanoate aminotransferase
MSTQHYHDRDIKHLWHPYTEITHFEAQGGPVIERAEGVYLYETGGRALLDGIASWWCVNLGHSHPRLVAAIREQAGILQHSILGGMSHPKAIDLAERLAEITPAGLNHAYFCGDGASSIEAALRMALQYWINIGETQRSEFICLADGYHGDTLGALAVGYVEAFHAPLKHIIRDTHRASSPHCAQCPCGQKRNACDVECFASMESLLREHADKTAAVIVEPLCQGAGGIRVYPDVYLQRLRNLCDECNVLLIADEIATGFGRTGSMFACDHAGIAPDLMTLGKGLTGGYLPMSAVMATDRIYDAFRRDGDRARTLYHGHTYCGNPITSAVALAALAIYEETNILDAVKPRIAELKAGMAEISALVPNADMATLGMIAAIEFSEEDGGIDRARRIAEAAYKEGLFIRPLGAVIYLWPPLTLSQEELASMLSILRHAVETSASA